MKAYVALFAVAALVSATLTPIVRVLAIRLGAVSRPGGRNVNVRAVPRYGGIAICVAFFVAVGALSAHEASTATAIHAELRRFLALIVGGLGLCAIGVLDDTRRVPALYKLYAQLIAGVVAFACGFRIDAILLPFIGTLSMGIFSLPVTVLWIVGITNAINLIDGLDGLAGGVVFFAATTNLIVAEVTGATFVAITMSAILGAVVGFLIFNFNPARIFMGDSGSYFLGFLLGTMSLYGASQKASTAVSLLVPILALGLPIVDTLLSIVRRFLERRPLFSPDRGHIHHRLLDLGLTHRRAVLVLYGISVVFTTAAVGVSLGRSWTVGLALLVASLVVVGVVRFVGYFEYLFILKRQNSRLRSRETELLRGVIPDAALQFASAPSDAEIWANLERIMTRAGITAVELVDHYSDRELAHWRAAGGADPVGDDDVVSTDYPLGPDIRARASLRFHWRSDSGDVSPQVDVLLQVLVDLIARSLERVRSRHAPQPVALPPVPKNQSAAALSTPQSS